MYRWLIAGTAFLVLAVSWGPALGGFGAFVTPLTEEMGWSRTGVSAAHSINLMVTFVVGIFWGWLSDRWSVRGVVAVTGLLMGTGMFLASISNSLWQMYLFYGFIAGLGLGGTTGPLTAMATRWFPERPGMAVGIIYAGFGAASAAMPVLAEYLISADGWRFGFRGLSFLIWGAFLLGAILLKGVRPRVDSAPVAHEGINPQVDPPDAGHPTPEPAARLLLYDEAGVSLLPALRTSSFWTLFAMMGTGSLAYYMILVHLVPRAVDAGVSSSTAVTLLTVTGLVNLVCTIAGGVLGDRFGPRRVYLASLLLLALAMFWLAASATMWMFYVFAVAFGVGTGGWFPQIPMLAARIFGTRHMGSIYAALLLGDGLGGVVGALVAGYVFDTVGSYRIAFVLAAGVALVGVVLSAVLIDRPYRSRSGIPSSELA